MKKAIKYYEKAHIGHSHYGYFLCGGNPDTGFIWASKDAIPAKCVPNYGKGARAMDSHEDRAVYNTWGAPSVALRAYQIAGIEDADMPRDLQYESGNRYDHYRHVIAGLPRYSDDR